MLKALGLIGLGRGRAARLRTDDQGRIAHGELPELDTPAIVCLQAGNVNSGAIDPFGPLIDWAHSQGAWVHVDGAFGLWAAACPELAGEVAGAAAADSWATDAHKWLNTTYDCGIALVRDGAALRAAMRAEASYLPLGTARDPLQFTPQSSQRARGAEVWAVLAALGRDGVSGLVASHVALARRFASSLAAGGLEIRRSLSSRAGQLTFLFSRTIVLRAQVLTRTLPWQTLAQGAAQTSGKWACAVGPARCGGRAHLG